MNIRLYNARLLTFEKDEEITAGELWTQDGAILLAGDPAGRCPPVFDREIDARGGVILPGFKNAHTHSAMTFLRGSAEDLPLQSWLEKTVFPAEARLTPEEAACFMRLAILEYLAGGVTACFDMYLFPREMARAAVEMGFRTVLCGQVNDFTSSPAQMEEEYCELNRFHPLVSYQLGFHAEYTTGKERLLQIAALAQKYKAPVYTHLSETQKETADCIARTGKTPLAYLDGMGMFEYGGGVFHGVYLSSEDIEICRKKGIGVVSNPASNAKLAS
ncbi:MAG: amidohydrolase family protein, partial [Oscillospiraceae bacterium]|nr:amidohydrolase family protein [Oscillospiraceae bacterium]